VAKSEERCNVQSLVMAVSNVEALSINNFQVLTWPVMVCRVVLEPFGESGLEKLLAAFPRSKL
jgi:hypothetical protein